ncbi:S24 family peptidase [Jiella avicenniae]|uniref:Phage repressor protein C, contains Cro/C1-type HTH and peptisase s24 domains n=1 Tax=Jiella avicenniae TaxID=2907202 RepID=A0A9X1NZ28_9HYPH|nr:S24 family peptidase [Jiella avicenniae]MCE7028440.1 hypothetical protein [Jiella avicenniae]
MGVGIPTYTHHENGTRAYGPDDAVTYARRFKTTPEWLLFGVARQTEIASAGVPEIDIRAGAGGGGMAGGEMAATSGQVIISADVIRSRWGLPDDYLRSELRMTASRAAVIEVTGDSGYNPDNAYAPGSLFPGDRVIVDLSDTRPSPPGAFLVHDGLGLVVKLVDVVRGSEPVRLRLSSRNPHYEPYEVVEGEARIIGRVRGRITAI